MLEGGRHTNLQRSFQQPGKSTDPLVFTPVEKGASFHTFCAKPQWRKRWVIDSGVLHLLPLMVEVMFRVAKHSPTGNAPRKIFHKNSLSLGAVWIFHTPASQSKVSSSWFIAKLVYNHLLHPKLITKLETRFISACIIIYYFYLYLLFPLFLKDKYVVLYPY